jgi:hypothetical protein
LGGTPPEDGANLDAVEVDHLLDDLVERSMLTLEVDRLAEAARVLAYLDTTGGFGVLARDTLVADAVGRIAADTHIRNEAGQDLDARQALAYKRDVLDDLARATQVGR